MSPLQPFIEFIHFLRGFLYYFFKVSYCIGRTIISILTQVVYFAKEIVHVIVIICEELYLFLYQLDESISDIIHYLGTTTNNGINIAVDTVLLCFKHIHKILSNTRIHTRLLASGIVNGIGKFFILLYDALILIGDGCCWLVLLIPRLTIQIFVEIGDMVVFAISGAGNLVLATVQVLMDDILKLLIAVLFLYLVIKKRRQLLLFTVNSFRKFITWIRRIRFTTLRRQFRFLTFGNRRTEEEIIRNQVTRPILVGQRETSCSSPLVNENQWCVVCCEHKKTVLLLPCKHLCLCLCCFDRLYGSENAEFCPLCRSSVEESISVYT